MAEESGLMVPIGKWVLRRACADAVAWQRAGLPPMPVAVNISAQQLRQRDLRTFPIRSIKIDRSFIRDLFTDARDAAIVRALIALAHELGRARPRGQTSDELANPIWPL